MFIALYGTNYNQMAEADAIACNYLRSLEKDSIEIWEAKSFLINTSEAKSSQFWIDNKARLSEAIAALKFNHKTIDKLTNDDYHLKNSIRIVLET